MANLKLWRLRQRRRNSAKNFSELIKKAGDSEEAESLLSEAADSREDFRDAILHLRSIQLIDEAEDLGIPFPSYGDSREAWEDGREPGTVHLKREAQIELQKAIRHEKREKWEVTAFFLKEIVTPIIGVLGAIMGLLTVIHVLHSK